MTLTEQITQLAKQAKAASRELAKLTTAEKNACLLAMAGALEKNADALKAANALDMDAGAKMGLTSAMLDRLNSSGHEQMNQDYMEDSYRETRHEETFRPRPDLPIDWS